jgi:hypothetical protein
MTDLDPDELRDMLQAAQRSQAWLARHLGIRAETVSHWMQGKWPIPASRHDRIRALLATDPDAERLRLAITRIFCDRCESDKIAAECLSVMPELCHTARGGVSVSYKTKGKN